MKINCEHAYLLRNSRISCNSKKPAQERGREGGGREGSRSGRTAMAVVIKEFSFEKRSPETHLAVERELGMRSNEWSFARGFKLLVTVKEDRERAEEGERERVVSLILQRNIIYLHFSLLILV